MALETSMAFTAAAAVLLVIAGPTMLLVVSYALGQGWRAALPMALGVALGDFTAMTLSMLGVGARNAVAIRAPSASSTGPAARCWSAPASPRRRSAPDISLPDGRWT